jgi:hypothetical protein
MATVTPMRKTKTVGSLIDAMYDVRERIRALNEQLKTLGQEKDAIEAELIALMDSEGVSKSTGKKASAGITETERPNVVSWDDFYKYIARTKNFHLLERRPSVSGCRELFETKGSIPGVEPFTQRTINLRSL